MTRNNQRDDDNQTVIGNVTRGEVRDMVARQIREMDGGNPAPSPEPREGTR
jgi:hypothetical protein